ncbi:type II toxin-antitoxin system HigB family toxin [Arachidicoccus soli]|uniref:Type II toxin-antitoxin system HigB family toxin n=1 Tax=Arachidicoccus soli TaxID=2341117 RepID=A0A386HQB4_9BACT|nr:type II toxin-antitoxin system HigB family toxin [Arachidicoccus soli]AYD48138.1 type II toxin-antitoxin system HigB family toxin [Arachidicoccus soli]
MVVVTKTRLNEFGKIHPRAAEPLNYWYHIVTKVDWANFADIKNTFNSVDAVGNDRFVFNIKGNSYRLVTMIHFDKRTIYVRFIGTHSEYDKIDCTTI